jgi:hypothetical protein
MVRLYQKQLAKRNVGILVLLVFWLCALIWLCTGASLWSSNIDHPESHWPGSEFAWSLVWVIPIAGLLYLLQQWPSALRRALLRKYSIGTDVFRDIERLSHPVEEASLQLVKQHYFASWWLFLCGVFSVGSVFFSWLWVFLAVRELGAFPQFYMNFIPFFLPSHLLLYWLFARWTKRSIEGSPRAFWSGVGYSILNAVVAGVWAVFLTWSTQNHVSCFWPLLEFFVGDISFGVGALTVAPMLLWLAASRLRAERQTLEELRTVSEEERAKLSLHRRGTILDEADLS